MLSLRVSVKSIAFFAVAALIYASCAPVISRHEKGAVTVRIGSGSGSRAVTDVVASFSSVTVTVTGDGMGTVSETVNGYSLGSPISLEVPAGDDRLVTVTAVPDWSGAEGDDPVYATAYGGSDRVDIPANGSASALIPLSVVGTSLFFPNYLGSSLIIASGIADGSPLTMEFGGGSSTDTAYDGMGRLFVSSGLYIYRVDADFSMMQAANVDYGSGPQNIAVNNAGNVLYTTYNNDYNNLLRIDMTQDSSTLVDILALPSGGTLALDAVVSVDSEGYVYVSGYDDALGGSVIVKLDVSYDGETAEATPVAAVTFQSVGLSYQFDFGQGPQTVFLETTDMLVQGGVLYILGRHVDIGNDYYTNSVYSRGMVVAVSTSDLSKRWESGWSGDSVRIPSNGATQLYGPTRFVGIKPRKLYILDEGFYVDAPESEYYVTEGTGLFDIDRVVEIDLEDRAISDSATGLGFSGDALFSDFSSYQIYNSDYNP